MADDLEKLLADALRLPEEARAALAGRLLESLDHEVGEEAEAEWSQEIATRLLELDRGIVQAVPWSEARRSILRSEDDPAHS